MTVPKPWLDLEGEPMVIRTLRKFVGLKDLERAVLAVLPDEVEQRKDQIAELNLPLDLIVCRGGERRQDSVLRALDCLGVSDEDLIVVHDAARPFVQPSLIIEVARRAWSDQAAISAIPSNDTIKELSADGTVSGTPPRDRYLRAQTPQAMRAGILRRGLMLARERGIELTDDASAAELLGFRVAIVQGRRSNFKITTAEDIALARFLLREEGE